MTQELFDKGVNVIHRDQQLNGKTALIVDDDRFHQYFTKVILNKLQVNTVIVSGGEAAIGAFDSLSFDMVLLDLKMPYVDGYTVHSHIREVRKSRVPILILTGTINNECIDAILEPGFTEVLQKPFGARHLKQMMLELFGTLSDSSGSRSSLYDITKIKYLVRGDQEFEKELIDKMIDSFNMAISDLLDKQNDIEAIKMASHKLQLSAKILASDRILSLLRQVNQAATNKNLKEMKSGIQKLEYWTRILISQLKSYYNE